MSTTTPNYKLDGPANDNCLSGFQCHNRFGNTCIAIASTDTQIAVPTGVCSGSEITGVAQGNFPDVVTATITDRSDTAGTLGAVRTVTREMVLLAPMFQLNFRSSDLVSEPTSLSASTTGTPITTPPSLTPTASTGSDPNDNLNPASDDASSTPNTTGQGGLSTGVVAGIGVGAALGGILFMAVVGWLWWTCVRKKRQSNTGILAPAEPGKDHGMGYIHSDGTWMAAHPYNQELPVPGPYQTPYSTAQDPYYSNVHPELGDSRTPVELATPESGHPGHAHFKH
jgi:hypothetical protein